MSRQPRAALLRLDGSLDTSFGAASTLGGSAPFTEGGAPVVLAPNATLSDADRGGASYVGTSLTWDCPVSGFLLTLRG